MYLTINLTFDNYAEFVRSMTPEAIDELMRHPVAPPFRADLHEGPEPEPGAQLVQEARTAHAEASEAPEPVIVPPEEEKPAETPTAPETSVDITEVRKLLTKIARTVGKEKSKELLLAAGAEKLTENFNAIMGAIIKARPAAVKGAFLKSVVVSSTMGPGVKINTVKLLNM